MYKTITSLLTFFCFSTVTIASSAPFVYEMKTDERHGKITSRYRGQESEQTLIHIQDAHANLKAQQNIAKLIDELTQKYFSDEKKIVGVEGAVGNVAVERFRSVPNQVGRNLAAEKLMREGILSGAEYAAITSDEEMELFGIEDEDLFVSNFQKHHALLKEEEKRKRWIQQGKEVLLELKESHFNVKLLDLDRESYEIEMGSFEVLPFLEKVSHWIQEYDPDPVLYDQIFFLFETIREQNAIDRSVLEKEKRSCLKTLPKNIPSKERSIQDLLSLCIEHNLPLEAYPNLANYHRIQSRLLSIDFYQVHIQLRQLLHEMKMQLAVSENEKKILAAWRYFLVLKDALSLEVKREESEGSLREVANLFIEELRSVLSEGNHSDELLTLENDLHAIIPLVEQFYSEAKARDHAFIQNLTSKMEKENVDKAFIITGGFHTKGILEEIKEKGINYIQLTPILSLDSEQELPFNDFMQGKLVPIAANYMGTLRGLALYIINDLPQFEIDFQYEALIQDLNRFYSLPEQEAPWEIQNLFEALSYYGPLHQSMLNEDDSYSQEFYLLLGEVRSHLQDFVQKIKETGQMEGKAELGNVLELIREDESFRKEAQAVLQLIQGFYVGKEISREQYLQQLIEARQIRYERRINEKNKMEAVQFIFESNEGPKRLHEVAVLDQDVPKDLPEFGRMWFFNNIPSGNEEVMINSGEIAQFNAYEQDILKKVSLIWNEARLIQIENNKYKNMLMTRNERKISGSRPQPYLYLTQNYFYDPVSMMHYFLDHLDEQKILPDAAEREDFLNRVFGSEMVRVSEINRLLSEALQPKAWLDHVKERRDAGEQYLDLTGLRDIETLLTEEQWQGYYLQFVKDFFDLDNETLHQMLKGIEESIQTTVYVASDLFQKQVFQEQLLPILRATNYDVIPFGEKEVDYALMNFSDQLVLGTNLEEGILKGLDQAMYLNINPNDATELFSFLPFVMSFKMAQTSQDPKPWEGFQDNLLNASEKKIDQLIVQQSFQKTFWDELEQDAKSEMIDEILRDRAAELAPKSMGIKKERKGFRKEIQLNSKKILKMASASLALLLIVYASGFFIGPSIQNLTMEFWIALLAPATIIFFGFIIVSVVNSLFVGNLNYGEKTRQNVFSSYLVLLALIVYVFMPTSSPVYGKTISFPTDTTVVTSFSPGTTQGIDYLLIDPPKVKNITSQLELLQGGDDGNPLHDYLSSLKEYIDTGSEDKKLYNEMVQHFERLVFEVYYENGKVKKSDFASKKKMILQQKLDDIYLFATLSQEMGGYGLTRDMTSSYLNIMLSHLQESSDQYKRIEKDWIAFFIRISREYIRQKVIIESPETDLLDISSYPSPFQIDQQNKNPIKQYKRIDALIAEEVESCFQAQTSEQQDSLKIQIQEHLKQGIDDQNYQESEKPVYDLVSDLMRQLQMQKRRSEYKKYPAGKTADDPYEKHVQNTLNITHGDPDVFVINLFDTVRLLYELLLELKTEAQDEAERKTYEEGLRYFHEAQNYYHFIPSDLSELWYILVSDEIKATVYQALLTFPAENLSEKIESNELIRRYLEATYLNNEYEFAQMMIEAFAFVKFHSGQIDAFQYEKVNTATLTKNNPELYFDLMLDVELPLILRTYIYLYHTYLFQEDLVLSDDFYQNFTQVLDTYGEVETQDLFSGAANLIEEEIRALWLDPLASIYHSLQDYPTDYFKLIDQEFFDESLGAIMKKASVEPHLAGVANSGLQVGANIQSYDKFLTDLWMTFSHEWAHRAIFKTSKTYNKNEITSRAVHEFLSDLLMAGAAASSKMETGEIVEHMMNHYSHGKKPADIGSSGSQYYEGGFVTEEHLLARAHFEELWENLEGDIDKEFLQAVGPFVLFVGMELENNLGLYGIEEDDYQTGEIYYLASAFKWLATKGNGEYDQFSYSYITRAAMDSPQLVLSSFAEDINQNVASYFDEIRKKRDELTAEMKKLDQEIRSERYQFYNLRSEVLYLEALLGEKLEGKYIRKIFEYSKLIGKLKHPETGEVITTGIEIKRASRDGREYLQLSSEQHLQEGALVELEIFPAKETQVYETTLLLDKIENYLLSASLDSQLQIESLNKVKALLNTSEIYMIEDHIDIKGTFDSLNGRNMIYLNKSLLSNPIALFHEVMELLGSQDESIRTGLEQSGLNAHTFSRGVGKDVRIALEMVYQTQEGQEGAEIVSDLQSFTTVLEGKLKELRQSGKLTDQERNLLEVNFTRFQNTDLDSRSILMMGYGLQDYVFGYEANLDLTQKIRFLDLTPSLQDLLRLQFDDLQGMQDAELSNMIDELIWGKAHIVFLQDLLGLSSRDLEVMMGKTKANNNIRILTEDSIFDNKIYQEQYIPIMESLGFAVEKFDESKDLGNIENTFFFSTPKSFSQFQGTFQMRTIPFAVNEVTWAGLVPILMAIKAYQKDSENGLAGFQNILALRDNKLEIQDDAIKSKLNASLLKAVKNNFVKLSA